MEDDELGARGLRDPGRVVEHPDRHVELLATLGVAHEAGDRRVDREHDPVLPRELPKRSAQGSPSRTSPRSRSRRPCSRARGGSRPPPRGSRARAPGPAEPELTHGANHAVRPRSYAFGHGKSPTHPNRPARARHRPPARRPLARGRGRSRDWNIDVVAAFMRAAYGKGYCDSLTEDAPGSLCVDHGYRVPGPGAPLRASSGVQEPRLDFPAWPEGRIRRGSCSRCPSRRCSRSSSSTSRSPGAGRPRSSSRRS